MVVWVGVVDTWSGRIVATSTNKKTGKPGHGLSARKLAQALNRYNAGPDYGGIGGLVNGKSYYRFHAFEFNGLFYFSNYYDHTLRTMYGDSSEFERLAEDAKAILQKQEKATREAAIKAELTKIESFDIPEEYKAVLREDVLRE